MSYYWFNRDELLQKAKIKYYQNDAKERAKQYYIQNKEAMKEKARNRYKNLSEKEK